MATFAMSIAEAKNNFSRVTTEANTTGRPVTIMRFGGLSGLRDEGLLDSALAQPATRP